MIKEKFRLISHPQTKLQFWVKCDKKKSKGKLGINCICLCMHVKNEELYIVIKL